LRSLQDKRGGENQLRLVDFPPRQSWHPPILKGIGGCAQDFFIPAARVASHAVTRCLKPVEFAAEAKGLAVGWFQPRLAFRPGWIALVEPLVETFFSLP